MKLTLIISGEKGSGKTTFVNNLIGHIKSSGLIVGGFIASHEFLSDCYFIKNLKTNEKTLLMKRVATHDKRPNHFKLYAKGVEMGNNCINNLLEQPPDMAIIDEIGRYELDGELWNISFTKLIESSIPLIFTTKANLLDEVVEKWSIKPTIIFQVEDFDDSQKAFERIKKLL